jgi:hypothetical protein
VKAQRKHVFQHCSRRLNVKNVGLHRPRTESIRLDSILNSDGDILMPRHFSIRRWDFVE